MAQGPTLDQIIFDELRREGGFVADPADHGGPTNHGITQATLSAWLGRPATIDDVRCLDEATAGQILRRRCVVEPGFDRLPPVLQPQVVDIGVNSGPGEAVMLLQRALNDLGYGPLVVDGGLGPRTLAAAGRACAASPARMVNHLADCRIVFLRRLVARDSSQGRFLAGWLARAGSFRLPADA